MKVCRGRRSPEALVRTLGTGCVRVVGRLFARTDVTRLSFNRTPEVEGRPAEVNCSRYLRKLLVQCCVQLSGHVPCEVQRYMYRVSISDRQFASPLSRRELQTIRRWSRDCPLYCWLRHKHDSVLLFGSCHTEEKRAKLCGGGGVRRGQGEQWALRSVTNVA